MVSDLPHALADALSVMERDRLCYVLYRDPKSDRRVVIWVEGPSDAAVIEAALGTAGAEQTAGNDGHEFVIHATDSNGATQPYVVRFKFTAEQTNVVNLLWLAAIDEGAAAARETVRAELVVDVYDAPPTTQAPRRSRAERRRKELG